MSESMNVRVLNQSCSAGDVYAKQHFAGTPKTALISCEGACLKGEVARRAANLIAHEIVPDRAVRICHGGAFLLNQGGMRDLVANAPQSIVIEGCPMACGSRIAKAAFPDKVFNAIVANSLYEGDDTLFGTNEATDCYIREKSTQVAEQVMDRYFGQNSESQQLSEKKSCCG